MTGDVQESSSFGLLAPQIQEFIWKQGWQELRDIQEQSIRHVLGGKDDLVISAATASGKTEAAMFPVISAMLTRGLTAADWDAQQHGRRKTPSNVSELTIYVSPLKALINDQFKRLTLLCDALLVPVWPWHGDVGRSQKQKFMAEPSGILLITPEALEATLCLRGTQIASMFGQCHHVVVDEVHTFIGTERGKQLQSLLHRVELAVGHRIRRIGLSATLGDMEDARAFMRPGSAQRVQLVNADSSDASVKVLIKGYEEPLAKNQPSSAGDRQLAPAVDAGGANDMPEDGIVSSFGMTDGGDDGEHSTPDQKQPEPVSPGRIATYLFERLRGTRNLIFPNSRRNVEQFTHALNKLCKEAGVPQEFWPHHGSLSREIRSATEDALKQADRPATGVCTNTLEMGIDIGDCQSVVQIEPPHTVSGLRQRMGRSGRREGMAAVLRGFVIEDQIDARSSLCACLRTQTLQMAAMVHLMLEKWYEPTRSDKPHYSTLVQQTLALIVQHSGLTAASLYRTLCGPEAPFRHVRQDDYGDVLRQLAARGLLMQDAAGALLLTPKGENLTGHYSFYASFATEEEFRVMLGGQTLGTMPISTSLLIGQLILFSGRNLKVVEIQESSRIISVAPARGGRPPTFPGSKGFVHPMVRETMRQIARGHLTLPFLDETARSFVAQARMHYQHKRMDKACIFDQGLTWHYATWMGDAANNALVTMLAARGGKAWTTDIGFEWAKGSGDLGDADPVGAMLHLQSLPNDPDVLLQGMLNLAEEKWDWALPPRLLRQGYLESRMDLPAARRWLDWLAVQPGRQGRAVGTVRT